MLSVSWNLGEVLAKLSCEKSKIFLLPQGTEGGWIIEALDQGPDFLDAFDGELFCELVERIIVESNTKIRFRLKNGMELPENIERTVR